MIPPINCPYKNLTAPHCWSCKNYIPDTDECALASFASVQVGHTGTSNNKVAYCAEHKTYEQRLNDYEKRRQELMQLSKEALVDLLIHRPTY